MTATAEETCGRHDTLGEELRALVLTALDRVGPVLDRLREEPATPGRGSCAACPVCAVLAALRGERPELAVRLAEQAAGLLAVLRAALDDEAPAPADPPPPAAARRVQHIHVDRPASRC
ncbi:hypothetical protein BJF78_29675 [Pseudonocardia sp. CNS-139]|nr:hypothetical protein BJF78_29675 [Pseudonocardia sp. CNS-139]